MLHIITKLNTKRVSSLMSIIGKHFIISADHILLFKCAEEGRFFADIDMSKEQNMARISKLFQRIINLPRTKGQVQGTEVLQKIVGGQLFFEASKNHQRGYTRCWCEL